MISVEIKINRKTIHKLSAVNIGPVKSKAPSSWRWYRLSCGCKLQHNRDKGALCMLIQMAGHAMLCKKLKSK